MTDTENKSEKYNKLDLWDTKTILDTILESQLNAIASIKLISDELELTVTKAVPLLEAGGRLIFAGAGTSGRIAAQECAELYPTFSWPKNKAHFLLAGGQKAFSEAIENAEDNIAQGEHDAEKLKPTAKDIFICCAASGRTPYTLGVMRTANLSGSLTIGISSVAQSPLLNEAKIKLNAKTGAEVIAGSTRMKAGTAQKVILNMLTTSIMIRLNRTYDSYMIDLVATNEKLNSRAIKIVAGICNVTTESAKESLVICKGKVKLACVYLKYKDLKTAEEILLEHAGNLRKCLE
ncbi:N-acetylmuramic acid 6-phosphate etherase [Pigmentibacter sp. JX0631]|uniref:N-acetylmuramic acid 6-phosphate etherase n=1 Tax=Pigmentibacter sp. JX0631 TaxID=2976982 RepID=UPI002468B7DD|nr:N-acetylmuramic acid 6-phosphate etherase [Pigmentibacter sp. JX0631]WGL60642.1 N-acetylmuramic acid 6-phosphate etherase [Pigmentibacter sp. JX0631]